MNILNRPILCGVLLLIAQHSLFSQVPPPMTCNATAAAPPVVRAEGRAELVSDIVLTCTGGKPTHVGFRQHIGIPEHKHHE